MDKLKPGQLVTCNGHVFKVKKLIFKCNQKCNKKEFRACQQLTVKDRLKLSNCLKLIK